MTSSKHIPGYCPTCQKEISLTPDDALVCPTCSGGVFAALDSDEQGEVLSGSTGSAEAPPLKVLLAALIEDLDDGVIACDSDGKITLFNRAARELFGLPRGPIPPEQWSNHYDLFHGDGETPLADGEGPLTWTLRGSLVKNVEIVVAPKDGQKRRYLFVTGRRVDKFEGRFGAVIVMHEITERKQEEALRIEAAERLARQRQALEINDNVVQSLVAGRWALGAGDTERAAEMIGRALDASVAIVREDLAEIKKVQPLKPGDFVRERGVDAAPQDV